MSQVKALKEQIDSLCQQKGVEVSYKTNSTIAELEEMLMYLQDDDSPETSENGDGEGGNTDGTINPEKPSETIEVPSGKEVGLVKFTDLLDEAIVEDKAVEVAGNEKGDVLIKAYQTLQLQSNGERVILKKDEEKYVEESEAMAAVEAGVAAFITA